MPAEKGYWYHFKYISQFGVYMHISKFANLSLPFDFCFARQFVNNFWYASWNILKYLSSLSKVLVDQKCRCLNKQIPSIKLCGINKSRMIPKLCSDSREYWPALLPELCSSREQGILKVCIAWPKSIEKLNKRSGLQMHIHSHTSRSCNIDTLE